MRLCVKIGGAQLEEAGARAVLARAIASARDAGHEIVVVHGGGNQIRALCRRLGIEDRYHDGLRITDAATATVATQVLCGDQVHARPRSHTHIHTLSLSLSLLHTHTHTHTGLVRDQVHARP